MRTRVSNKLLYLSLVFYLINLNLLLVIVNATGSSDQSRSITNNRLENSERALDGAGTSPGLEVEDLELGEGEEEEEENELIAHEDNKFAWKHHREDHGIYSGRSLLSAEDIKPRQGLHSDQLEEDEDLEDISARRKSYSKLSAEDEPDPLKTIDYAEKEWQLMFRSFDSAYDSLMSSVLQEIGKQTNIFSDIISRLNPTCQRDIYYIRDSVKKHKLWALRMLDSNGKLPSGITYGRFSSPGDFEECLSVRVDDNLYKDVKKNIVEKHKFHGKYCLLDFRLPLPERPQNKLLSIHESVLNFTGTDIGRQYPDLIQNYSAYASVFYEVGYLHAFCLPSTCDVQDVTRAVGKALEGMYLIVNNTIDCEERLDEPVPLRKSQWIAIIFLTVVFVNAFVASIAYNLLPEEIQLPSQGSGGHDQRRASMKPPQAGGAKIITKNGEGPQEHKLNRLNLLEEAKRLSIVHKQSGLRQVLTDLSLRHKFYSDCFSIQKNFERLTKPDPRGLTFVHYTRIVAMALTVITHTGALGTLQAITKPADASNSEQIFRDLIPQMLANAFTSIQIFFFMAGFMLVISTFPSIKRDKGHISFMEYAIKRAIRLMPGLAATICLNFIWPLVVDGPMLKFFDRAIVEPCEKNWWHTMAFLSNFDHVEKMCLRHSYFSASDYQLHIVAFPLLVLLYKQPSLALFLAAIFTVSGFVAQIIMILTKTVLPFMMVDYIDKEAFFNVVHYIHHPVWNHMSAFFYGFIIGYLVVTQVRVNLSEKTIKRIWIILMPLGIASIFAPYFWNHYKRPIYKWQMVLYVIFDRFILLSTCAWLSYATMVLARKPPAKNKPSSSIDENKKQSNQLEGAGKQTLGGGIKSPIERVLTKGQPTTLATFDTQRSPVMSTQDIPSLASQSRLRLDDSGSLTSLPRQRSSPNLVYLQQQMQQHQQQQQLSHQSSELNKTALIAPSSGRLSRTVSSSNLATIVETNQPAADKQQLERTGPSKPNDEPSQAPAGQDQQQPAKPKPRSQAPVSNINILCLVLSRLTFQLYLFNMVVLCVDVNHSKYFWFFSYYFIVFKAASVYICSAIMAMIFFVVLESPSLTLYIAWVKGRAVARARAIQRNKEKAAAEDVKIVVPPPLVVPGTMGAESKATVGTAASLDDDQAIRRAAVGGGESVELRPASTTKPTFSFIDLSSSSPAASESASTNGRAEKATSSEVDQTKM
uniref:Nose resistant to fluoxetine protein 6 n=1 Tax=Aceria tosichella TaxID=561515 RepID=A0A6G1SME6_9ACAR